MPQQQAPRIITTGANAPPSNRPYHSDSDSDGTSTRISMNHAAWCMIFDISDEEIHRLKVQSPVDEVAELALDDIGKFPCELYWS